MKLLVINGLTDSSDWAIDYRWIGKVVHDDCGE